MRHLSLLIALALMLGGTPVPASVSVGTADDVAFGDLASLDNAENLTVAVTVTLTASPTEIRQTLIGQWSSTNGEAAFVLMTNDPNTDELWGVFGCDSAGAFRVRATTDVNLTNGSTYRIVVRLRDHFSGGDKEILFWVNGAQPGMGSVSGAEGACTGLPNSTQPLTVGDVPDDSPRIALPGNYSEVAIWTEAVPEWVAVAYGKGMSPLVYRTSASVLYARLVNTATDGLRDLWTGLAGTNTGGSAAAHPAMYYASDGR